MNRKKYIYILCMTALSWLFLSCSQDKGTEREYNGPQTAHYQREAVRKLNDFYNHLLEALAEPQVTQLYIDEMKQQLSTDQSVFLPDFSVKKDETNSSSLENYILKLQEVYSEQVVINLTEPEYFQFRIEEPDYGKITYTADGSGFRVPVNYTLTVIAGEQVLFEGESSSVVLFPDFTSTFSYQIAQISPKKPIEQPEFVMDQSTQSAPKQQKLPEAEPNANTVQAHVEQQQTMSSSLSQRIRAFAELQEYKAEAVKGIWNWIFFYSIYLLPIMLLPLSYFCFMSEKTDNSLWLILMFALGVILLVPCIFGSLFFIGNFPICSILITLIGPFALWYFNEHSYSPKNNSKIEILKQFGWIYYGTLSWSSMFFPLSWSIILINKFVPIS